MVDDYGGYKALFIAARQAAPPCIELGCWAHARRKFFDLHQANASSMALEALTRIGQLYYIEQQGMELSIEARLQLRVEQSQPALNALHEWLIQTRIKTANGGGSAKALDYVLKRWPALIRYAETGHLPIDNNPVENVIRLIALGKKNWLLTGSERAGPANGHQPSKRCWVPRNTAESGRPHGSETPWKNCRPGLIVVSTSHCRLHLVSKTLG
jgi:hypothetical protein